MIVKEKEAVGKICPFSMSNGTVNRSCKGKECMGWRYSDYINKTGYCGIAYND